MLGGNSSRVRPENSKQCASETRSGAMTEHGKLFRNAAISSKFGIPWRDHGRNPPDAVAKWMDSSFTSNCLDNWNFFFAHAVPNDFAMLGSLANCVAKARVTGAGPERIDDFCATACDANEEQGCEQRDLSRLFHVVLPYWLHASGAGIPFPSVSSSLVGAPHNSLYRRERSDSEVRIRTNRGDAHDLYELRFRFSIPNPLRR